MITTDIIINNINNNDKKDNSKKLQLNIEEIYPHEFWLEKYNKLNKIRPIIFDAYVPNKKSVVPITNKFYSKYDTEYINLEKNLKIDKYLNLIENTNNGYNRNVEGNKSQLITVKPLIKYDKDDRQILFKPIQKSDLSSFAEKLQVDKITERPMFNGKTFKLQ